MVIEFSEVTYLRTMDSFIAKYTEMPDSYPKFDFENVIYDKNEINLEEEVTWLKDHYKNMYEHTFHTYPILKEGKNEELKLRYAIYIFYCYSQYKPVPFTFEEFNEHVEEIDEPFVIQYMYGGDVGNTRNLMHNAERIIRYQMFIKESIERCLDPSIHLSFQTELIENIIECFELRNEREIKMINALLETKEIFNADELLALIHYTHLDEEKLIFRVGDLEIEKNASEFSELLDGEIQFETLEEPLVQNAIKANKLFTKYYWFAREKFTEHEKDVFVGDCDEPNHLWLYYEDIEMELKFDEENLYRITGEKIIDFDAIIHEMFQLEKEISGKRDIIDKRAKGLFYTYLSPFEKKQYEELNAVFIEGVEFDYILHEKTRYNNIIRMTKDKSEKKLMCVTPVNLNISKYDVKATTVMLIKTGKEEILNQTANYFPSNEADEEIISLFSTQQQKLIV